MKHRAPLDTDGGRPTPDAELNLACQVVDGSGVVRLLEPLLTSEVGRPRSISLRAFLVAAQVNALARHHQAHLVEVARVINAWTDPQRARLVVRDHDPAQTYHRVDRLFNKLGDVLEHGHVLEGRTLDAKWLANALAQAAVPGQFRTSSSLAVDGTDVETWGALHGDPVTLEMDGEAAGSALPDDPGPKVRRPARRALVLGVGPDGRKRYTVDPDARAGHRSATNSRPAGPYVGYELHLVVRPGTCAGPAGWTRWPCPKRSPGS